jgi:uncharacterized membrane protein
MGVMGVFFKVVLGIHIVAGAVALLVFWIPLVTRKGGRTHRRMGWVYVAAAATIAVTGLLRCAGLMADGNPRHWRAGVFLAYVGLFAAASAQIGVRALGAKGRTVAPYRAIDRVLPVLLVAGGGALAAYGLSQSKLLYVLFAALGAAQGSAYLRFWRTVHSSGHEWFLAHMSGMGTSCITTLTAFAVVNAPRLGLRTFDISVWAAPIAALGTGLTVWRGYYAKRLLRRQSVPGYEVPGAPLRGRDRC